MPINIVFIVWGEERDLHSLMRFHRPPVYYITYLHHETYNLVGSDGFEPSRSLSESDILPLYDKPVNRYCITVSGVLSWTIICLGESLLTPSSGNFCLAPYRGYARCMLPYKARFLKPYIQPLPDLLAKPSAV